MRDWILDHAEEAIFFEPAELDRALIGVAIRPNMSVPAYDYHRLVEAFMETGMSNEEAVEWIETNTLRQWMGEATPVVIYCPVNGV